MKGGYVQKGNIILPLNVIECYMRCKCYIQDNKAYTSLRDIEIDLDYVINLIDNNSF
jgi:hypothetical protein